MKYCQKCGNQISDDAQFCPACGQSQQMQPAAKPIPRVQRSGGKKLHCPNCGSTSLSAIVESDVTGGTSYSRSVTKKASVSTMEFTNVHRNYWMCSDCGEKFRNLQNLKEEIASNEKSLRIFTILFCFVALSSAILSLVEPLFLIMLVIALAAAVAGITIYKNRIAAMRKEKIYLERNCFD